jgi:4-alpha-glucanotransferase
MKLPVYNWLDTKGAGLLLHPTSLPGKYGIGTLGKSLYQALDFMYESGLQYWQVCPLGPTGFGDSPYQSFSAFALNPYLIDVENLVELKLLTKKDLLELAKLPQDHVDFGELYQTKWPVLKKAYKNYVKAGFSSLDGFSLDFEQFKSENEDWLHPYCLFMAIKDSLNGASWDVWDKEIASYKKAKSSALAKSLAAEADAYAFYQYIVYGQWERVRSYAAERSISIIGDIPIFVAYDSADTWSNPEIFKLSKTGRPEVVAGVPPDYFSEDGQLWGNPLYNWKVLEASGYDWWMKRCGANFKIYDVVRIDHFRGFCDYWEIKATEKTAKNGVWKKGPGLNFFKKMKELFPDAKVIAEDLGIITDEVRKLRDDSGLPGMAILHFAFDGSDDNVYLPSNVVANCVIYPGTHDNDTTRGWYEALSGGERENVKQGLNTNGDHIAWDLIEASMKSKCNLAVIAMQDFLDLGTEARLNSPGTAAGNWQWRCSDEDIQKLLHEQGSAIYSLIESTGRYNP